MCSHTIKTSLEEVIVMYFDKMKGKYMKENILISFFVNLLDDILQFHYDFQEF